MDNDTKHSYNPSPAEEEKVFNQWALAVGRFILQFCNLEKYTFMLLEKLPSEPINAYALGLSFNQRVNLIRQVIANKGLPEEHVDVIDKLLARALKLAEKRNLIAHNPLYLQYDQIVRRTTPYDVKKTIDFHTLKGVDNELEELHEELHDALLASDSGIS